MRPYILTILLISALVILGGAYLIFGDYSPPTRSDTNQSPVTSGENPEPGSAVHDLPIEPAAAAARQDLAQKLSIPATRIVILNIEEKTWSDGCLGLGGPAESCLQALVEGFRVEILADGQTYFYRTDQSGTSVRLEGEKF